MDSNKFIFYAKYRFHHFVSQSIISRRHCDSPETSLSVSYLAPRPIAWADFRPPSGTEISARDEIRHVIRPVLLRRWRLEAVKAFIAARIGQPLISAFISRLEVMFVSSSLVPLR